MYIFYFFLSLFIISVDYFTKALAVNYLKPRHTLPVIKDVFHFTYCENTGGAFSIFSGNPYLLAFISLLFIGIAVAYIIVKKPKSHLLLCSLCMICAGGIGNVIDRIVKGYVVDFFDFRIINFAVFNVADIFVCVGMALLIIYVLFFDNMEKKQ